MPKLKKEEGGPRTRGTGSIITKPNSRFLYIAYYDANGKQHQETTKSQSLQVAEAQLRKKLEDVAKGVPVEQSRKLKYQDIKELLLTDYKNNGVDLVERRNGQIHGMAYLDAYFGGMHVKNINSQVLRKFVAQLQEGKIQKTIPEKKGRARKRKDTLSNASINRILALLRRMMYLAKKDGLVPVVPHFPMLEEKNVRKGFVETEQFKSILQHLPEQLRPLVIFLYRTGCRVGAALQITWGMVNPDCTVISLPGEIVKNDEPLTLPVPSEVTAILRKHFRQENQPVFSGINLRKEWEKATLLAKCPHLLIHDLRRSGVRNLVQAGVQEKVAMSISGHKTRSIFDRYNIISAKQVLDAMKQVEQSDGSLLKVDGSSMEVEKLGRRE